MIQTLYSLIRGAIRLLVFILLSSFICYVRAQNGAVTTTQSFSYTGQIVTWTVPTGVTSLTIEARGAAGGDVLDRTVAAGKGAIVAASVSVTPGQPLSILVGLSLDGRSAGGGGSFVVAPPSNTAAPTPLVIAGGGSGAAINGTDAETKHGQAGTDGGRGGAGAGGTAGSGGNSDSDSDGGGGGGFLGNGGGINDYPNAGGRAFVNGGAGGQGASFGGFGGGGGTGRGAGPSGGGGGYSGGGGSNNSDNGLAGGGGSFTAGTRLFARTGATDGNSGNGLVIISYTLSTIRYVKQGGTGDGSSWTNASGDLQAMIDAQSVQQVWVAGGTYQPASGGSFAMKNGVAIYGGFMGSESSLASRPSVNPIPGHPSSTTLLGNGNNVIVNPGGLTSGAVLDGFVIQGGRAGYGNGGGIYNFTSSPRLTNLVFTDNSATQGGGIYNLGSSPNLTSCVFTANTADDQGGGIYNYDSSPVLTNCLLTGNNAANQGGAFHNYSNSNPRLVNCTLTDNSAGDQGGAISEDGTTSQLINAILFNNGGAKAFRFINDGSTTLTYSLIESGATAYISSPTNQTVTSSPFVSATDFTLNACSVAIDKGDNAANNTTTDLAGNARTVRTIDIGAYEFQGTPSTPVTITSQPPSGSSVTAGASVSVPVSVSGTVSTYQWYKDNLNSPVTGQNTATLTLSNVQLSDAGSYSLVATGACNSVTSTAFSLSVSNPTPTITGFTAAPSPVCVGSPVTLTATIGNVTGSYTFTLTNGSSLITGSNGNATFSQTLTASGSGQQTFTLTVSSSNQLASATTTLTVNALPTASLTASPSTVLSCAQTSLTLTAGSGDSYAFSGPGIVSQSGNQASVNAPGTYSVTVTSSGCSSTTGITISQDNTAPSASLASNGGLSCSNTSVTLTASPAGQSYQFSAGATPIGTTNQATVTTAGIYSVTVLSGTGCSSVASTTVTGDQTTPSVSINPTTAMLSCVVPSVLLTANTSASSLTWNTGETTNSISVSVADTYSVTVTSANGCMAMAQATVGGTTAAPVAPTLSASPATTTTNQPITITANSCSGGTINWTAIGGTGQASGNTYTLSQPGNYTLSATCSLNGCTSVASAPLSVQIRPGGFAITGVSMVNCQLTNPDRGEYQVQFTPQYAGQTNSPISFAVVNELASTTAPAPYSLRLYTDNSVITLVATQAGNGEARFAYNWLASCQSGTSPNQPPTTTGIPSQTILVGQGYQLQLTSYLDDPDGQALSFQVSGLPAGLSLTGSVISGTPSQTGVSTVNVTALDPGGLPVSTSFQLTVSPMPVTPPTGFAIVGVSTVNCQVISAGERRLTFTPQYAGVSGAPISFSVVNELVATTSPGPYSLNLYTDNPAITLSAQQGATVSTYRYNWLAVCNPAARVGTSEPGSRLQVRVLGNPVTGNTAQVEISGASGQALQLNLVDLQGKSVYTYRVEQARTIERLSLPLGASNGVLLLQVNTPTQRQQVKLLRF